MKHFLWAILLAVGAQSGLGQIGSPLPSTAYTRGLLTNSTQAAARSYLGVNTTNVYSYETNIVNYVNTNSLPYLYSAADGKWYPLSAITNSEGVVMSLGQMGIEATNWTLPGIVGPAGPPGTSGITNGEAGVGFPTLILSNSLRILDTLGEAVPLAGSADNELTLDGSLVVGGSFTAGSLFGDGAGLTNIPGEAIVGGVVGATNSPSETLRVPVIGWQTRSNYTQRLTIPTADGTNAMTHFSIVDAGTNWNGWRFWATHTPYPPVGRERVHVCVSSNGVNWQTPAGGSNPIIAGIKADPCLLITTNGTAVIYCTVSDAIYATTSTDGVNWTPYANLNLGTNLCGPIAIHGERGQIELYTQQRGASWGIPYNSESFLCRWTATDGTGTNYSTREVLTGLPTMAWHSTIERAEGVLWLLVNTASIAGQASEALSLFQSEDGLSWTRVSANALNLGDVAMPNASGFYKPAALYQGRGRWNLYLSSRNVNTESADLNWGIYLVTNAALRVSTPILADGTITATNLTGTFGGQFNGLLNATVTNLTWPDLHPIAEEYQWGFTLGFTNSAPAGNGEQGGFVLRTENTDSGFTWLTGTSSNLIAGVPVAGTFVGNGSGLTNYYGTNIDTATGNNGQVLTVSNGVARWITPRTSEAVVNTLFTKNLRDMQNVEPTNHILNISCPSNSGTSVTLEYAIQSVHPTDPQTNALHRNKYMFNVVNNGGTLKVWHLLAAGYWMTTISSDDSGGNGDAGLFPPEWTFTTNTNTVSFFTRMGYSTGGYAGITNHIMRILNVQNLSTNLVEFIP